MLQLPDLPTQTQLPMTSIEDAYEECRQITAEYSKTFYLGTRLMAPEKRRAIWAIYVWCRRTDELVDGPKAATTTLATLDEWERQLEDIFAGRPRDRFDVALADTIERFPLKIEPFRDMIAGQRMDLRRNRYETFEDLKLYCYRVAGTVGLMSEAVMGSEPPNTQAPWSPEQPRKSPIDEAVALGIANQLTNILRDVGEDRHRGRIYLPMEDLDRFGYSEVDLMAGTLDQRWSQLMQFQINRARQYYVEAECGIRDLHIDARWPVWTASILYSQILNEIERNNYDVFSRRAYVSGFRKAMCLPVAWLRAQVL
ncbi:MAG: phytoene synthase [Coleofasciculaceae cyanobacterium RL_1_1]|nr:phytoene synthase [Coleofasciculaceae cyanobacterium RL_1_1]